MITWVALGISNQSERYFTRVVLRALSLINTTFSNGGVFKKKPLQRSAFKLLTLFLNRLRIILALQLP